MASPILQDAGKIFNQIINLRKELTMDDLRLDKDHNAERTTFTLDAVPKNFQVVQDRVRDFLSTTSCSMRTLLELDMVVEEIFINIANYAYGQDQGKATVDLALNELRDTLSITFRDSGVPYNPLEKSAPDISSSAKERAVGGLGIFLVQKYSDSMAYEYKGNENCLTIYKKIN